LVYFQFHKRYPKILLYSLIKQKTKGLLENFNIQRVLVAPLDWGLGHATRCIPIIRALLNEGYEVVIAAENAQAILLQNEFPSLLIIPLRGYWVTYSKHKRWLPVQILMQLPRLLGVLKQEKKWLDTVIEQHKIDLVISDNRYGLSSKKVPCIFITHQLTIKTPFVWLERLIQKINYSYINQFTACWVPDAPGEDNLAGILSHPEKLPVTRLHYIGMLSRFQITPADRKYDYCILLSGPEPQRTLLENKIIPDLSKLTGKILLVRGKPGSNEIIKAPENTEVRNHLPGNQLQTVILQSDCIVSRSGYSTIMELMALRKKSIFIPTPGQTEQEYLAKKLALNHICLAFNQENLHCEKDFQSAINFEYRFPDYPIFKEEDITALLILSTKKD
jgi:uncharacterized protein (TIGR00661 family)